MIPERQLVTHVDEINFPVLMLFFKTICIFYCLTPLSDIYIELFKFVCHARPGNDFLFFNRCIFIKLCLQGLFLVMNALHTVHDLVPLVFSVRREHFDLHG